MTGDDIPATTFFRDAPPNGRYPTWIMHAAIGIVLVLLAVAACHA